MCLARASNVFLCLDHLLIPSLNTNADSLGIYPVENQEQILRFQDFSIRLYSSAWSPYVFVHDGYCVLRANVYFVSLQLCYFCMSLSISLSVLQLRDSVRKHKTVSHPSWERRHFTGSVFYHKGGK